MESSYCNRRACLFGLSFRKKEGNCEGSNEGNALLLAGYEKLLKHQRDSLAIHLDSCKILHVHDRVAGWGLCVPSWSKVKSSLSMRRRSASLAE